MDIQQLYTGTLHLCDRQDAQNTAFLDNTVHCKTYLVPIWEYI